MGAVFGHGFHPWKPGSSGQFQTCNLSTARGAIHSKGTSRLLIITTLRIVRAVCLNSLKADQRPIEGNKKKKNEKLYEGETCAHSNEITRREISVRIPYDQNS